MSIFPGLRHARVLALVPAILMTGAVPRPVSPPADPMDFFVGRTVGEGQLHVILHGVRHTHVEGSGRREGAMLVLNQRVDEQGEVPRNRVWHIRKLSPGHYVGTLSDAVGPVEGTVDNGRLHLSYPMAGGVAVDQMLVMSADGREAINRMTIRKFGLRVAHLDEIIRRVD